MASTKHGDLKFVVLGSGDRPDVEAQADILVSKLKQHASVTHIDLGFASDLSTCDANIAIVLGGDGSILRAFNQMGERQLPIIGVNLGKLGFLAHFQMEDLLKHLSEICGGNYRVVRHLTFDCHVLRDGRVVSSRMGLNETAVIGGPPYSLLDVDLYVDSELVTTYSCDGLIVSTPVGSTAHSLSAGGPILRQDLQAFVISPISPHSLTVRPVVDSADRTYQMQVRAPLEETSVVVDGQRLRVLEAGDRVKIEKGRPEFRLVEVSGQGYYRSLREKLGWRGTIRCAS